MKFGINAVVVFILTASVSAQPTASQPAAVTVIHAGTLIDGTSSAPRRDQAIVVTGQRIERVIPWRPPRSPPARPSSTCRVRPCFRE